MKKVRMKRSEKNSRVLEKDILRLFGISSYRRWVQMTSLSVAVGAVVGTLAAILRVFL